MVGRRQGFTVIECMVALSVLTIVLSAVMGGEETQRQTIAHAFTDLQAHLAASSRLDDLDDGRTALVEGTHDVDLGLEGLRGRETVTLLEPGLHEVRVRVLKKDGTRVAELVTRIAREVAP